MRTQDQLPLLLSLSASSALITVGDLDVTVALELDADGNAQVTGSSPHCEAAERFVAAEYLDLVTERALSESRDAGRAYFRTGEVV